MTRDRSMSNNESSFFFSNVEEDESSPKQTSLSSSSYLFQKNRLEESRYTILQTILSLPMANHVHEIIPRLYVGDYIAAANLPFLQEKKISLIINATKHIPHGSPFGEPRDTATLGVGIPNRFEPEIEYIRVPVDDVSYDPSARSAKTDNLEPAEIQQLYLHAIPLIPRLEEAYAQGRSMLFHCHAGQQRSAALAVIFLMYHFRRVTGRPYHSRDAIFYLTSKRPIAFQGGRYVNFQEAI
jgi:hypothetical protein